MPLHTGLDRGPHLVSFVVWTLSSTSSWYMVVRQRTVQSQQLPVEFWNKMALVCIDVYCI